MSLSFAWRACATHFLTYSSVDAIKQALKARQLVRLQRGGRERGPGVESSMDLYFQTCALTRASIVVPLCLPSNGVLNSWTDRRQPIAYES